VIDAVLSRLPRPLRELLYKHRELLKFAVVGGICFVIDTAVLEVLTHTVMDTKPVTAKFISTTIATIASYYMNKEWSFRTRGGRAGHHEMALFFLFSALAVIVTTAPLWLSRYAFHLETPYISRAGQEIADLVSAQIIGTLLAMVFRYWAFRRFVFPDADARPRTRDEKIDLAAAELLGDVWPLVDVDGESEPAGHPEPAEDPATTRR
jgi:putative flippase GtrA